MTDETDVAVIGVGCRFPDAWTPAEFWDNIDGGVVSVREIPFEELRRAGVSDRLLNAPDYVRTGATVPGLDEFAADFFGYSPREAELIDPQQRIFLESCWEALESAGHPAQSGDEKVGVFAGVDFSRYSAALLAMRASSDGMAALDDADVHLGGLPDFLTSRVAYKLGLSGPAVTVGTACSSSLTAVHYAVLSLLSGECEFALAGGAGLPAPASGYRYQPGGTMSQDGFCRSFDIRSSGTGHGAGVGVVVLRALADALADGDHILAVIKGSAIGNDGAQRPGFTAPSPAGVTDVVSTALQMGGVRADQLGYVEAHGSGTPLGDHIELVGLRDALRRTTDRSGYCGLGSIKSNVGHCGAAAGIAGLIKAVHVAETGSLPPHPLFDRPRDPGLLADSPFHIPRRKEQASDANRHVLVHSMGLGGTNAAVVLAPPPHRTRRHDADTEPVRLAVSARNRKELDNMSRRLADDIERRRYPVSDIVHTLRVGRATFAERRVITGRADELPGLLRMPRPPAVQTVRGPERAVLVVVPEDLTSRTRPLLASLSEAFDGLNEVVPIEPDRVTNEQFVLVLSDGDNDDDVDQTAARYVLRIDDAAAVDAALTTAWLHGVPVRWAAYTAGGATRVPLPTYPLRRSRFWALDPAALAPVTAQPTSAVVPAEPDSTASSLAAAVLGVWRELFGRPNIGLDDEFGALGGSSMLGVRMALEIQQRTGVLINLHRAGGSRATARGTANVLWERSLQRSSEAIADGDGGLVDADLALDLGPLGATRPAVGAGTLLTGATGYLGAFILAELLRAGEGDVYCLVRADDPEQGRARLVDAAHRYLLPEPDRDRVHVIPGDLSDAGRVLDDCRDGTLARHIGLVLHCAAEVVFTEPYRVLRESNVLGTAALLRWARAHRIDDFSFVSTLAACGPALGGDGSVLEARQQPLDPRAGGYGVSKWVCERLLDRAEQDGLRVRVFRPGVILGASDTGACNTRDMIWRLVAGGLAIGAHPLDDRPLHSAPVDVVARAITDLSTSPQSVARSYHLIDAVTMNAPDLFALLAEAGSPTEGIPLALWHKKVTELGLATGNEVLASLALYELESEPQDWAAVECFAWRDWLRRTGVDPSAGANALNRSVRYLARRSQFQELLT